MLVKQIMLMGAQARQFGRGKVSVTFRNTEDREWRTMSRDGVREGMWLVRMKMRTRTRSRRYNRRKFG
jgi:hypothetical protein